MGYISGFLFFLFAFVFYGPISQVLYAMGYILRLPISVVNSLFIIFGTSNVWFQAFHTVVMGIIVLLTIRVISAFKVL